MPHTKLFGMSEIREMKLLGVSEYFYGWALELNFKNKFCIGGNRKLETLKIL